MSGIERSARQLLEFLYLLARTELKARYRDRVLGYVWAASTPFALAFVYWIVFKVIMRIEVENYSVYLVTGMFPWAWMHVSVVGASRSFVAHAPLVRELGVAHAVLPLSNVAAEAAHFVLTLPLVIAWVVIAGGYSASASWLWQLPLLFALQAVFIYPIALACALANAYVRDVDYLLGIAFPLLFFATPMVYPIAMVPDPLAGYFELNPLHALMQSWRAVFLTGTADWAHMAYAAAFAIAAYAAAWLLYRRLAPRVGEVL